MSFTRNFDGKSTLDELQRGCVGIELLKIANLSNVEGRNAQLDDGTKMNVNVATFEPQDKRKDVVKDLKFVKKADATVAFIAQMTQEGRAQVGNAGGMDVFIADKAETILIFGKK